MQIPGVNLAVGVGRLTLKVANGVVDESEHLGVVLIPAPIKKALSSLVDLPMSSEQTAATLDRVDLGKFQAHKTFTPGNAASMAALATLAYSAPADQKRHLARQPAIESIHLLDSKNNRKLGIEAPDTGTQLTVVETCDALLVAARGTTPPWIANVGKDTELQWQDYVDDIDTVPVRNYDSSADVHAGFKDAADGIWGQVSPLLQQAAAAHKAIHISGHSLGRPSRCSWPTGPTSSSTSCRTASSAPAGRTSAGATRRSIWRRAGWRPTP